MPTDSDNQPGLVPPMHARAIYLKKKAESIHDELMQMKSMITVHNVKEFVDEEISVRLEIVEELQLNFNEMQSKLEEEDFDEIGSPARSNFTAAYIHIKSLLCREINSRRSIENAHSSTVRHQSGVEETPTFVISQPRRRLPVLHIPQFSGAYTEWPDFIAMFNSVISGDPDLTTVEKFQHLRSCLKESALDAIRSLEINDDNYTKAMHILENRFNKKRLTFQSHLKEVFSLEKVGDSTSGKLRHLSDKLNANIRALQTMGSKEQLADCLIIHVISSKLDNASQMKWEEGASVSELPTLISFQSFLERRCLAMESIDNAMVSGTVANQVKENALNTKQNRKALLVSANQGGQCSFCGSGDHKIYTCKSFEGLTPDLRYKECKRLQLCLNCLKKGHMIKGCKSSGCRQCSAKHHTLLHISANAKPTSSFDQESATKAEVLRGGDAAGTAQNNSVLISSQIVKTVGENKHQTPLPVGTVILATAQVLIKNKQGAMIPCRAILDSCSQLHFISARFANHLQLKRNKTTTFVSGIGQSNMTFKDTVDIFMQSRIGDFNITVEAVVTPQITENQPSKTINTLNWKIPCNLPLADPNFFEPKRIDLLLGGAVFYKLLCVGQIELGPEMPILQKTKLGWIIGGGRTSAVTNHACLSAVKALPLEESNEFLENIVQRFWDAEEEVFQTKLSTDDDPCEAHFCETYCRLESGEYSVKLPFQRDAAELGESYPNALARFTNLERKLQNKPDLKQQYVAFMSEYRELGHMSAIQSGNANVKQFYLPHHCVLNAESSSTKLRVVFDGSARSSSGISLNNILMTGPTIQPKLFCTLLRFRSHKVALTGDISKMYRCVRMSSPDNWLQCILWRDSPSDPIESYTLDTVTYGTKPAAFLAIRAMQQLANDERQHFPIGSATIFRDFYVDDLLSGGNSVSEVLNIQQQTTALLAKGNFKIRKWCSNDPKIIETIPESEREIMLKFHNGKDITKTLGLYWDPKIDEFLFWIKLPDIPSVITKRKALSIVARIYDPLGLISPVITKAKILLQQLWKEKLAWDESLPQNLQTAWSAFFTSLQNVDKISLPRCVLPSRAELTLHGFCDASPSAYGACIYMHGKANNISFTNLLCSRSRVAPVKALTIPKLELSGAALLAELVVEVTRLEVFKGEIHCWCDSTIVLAWIKNGSKGSNVFVANRAKKIKKLTEGMSWHYVPSELNPADILSRGASPNELINSSLWKNGPGFLQEPSSTWPQYPNTAEIVEMTSLVSAVVSQEDLSLDCKFINSFYKLQKTYAYVYKFYCRDRSAKNGLMLTPKDLKNGTYLLLRMIQKLAFSSEFKCISSQAELEKNSKLRSLNPFIDTFGLIRVGGRLHNADLCFDTRHPIILPRDHPITDSIIMYFHLKLLHAGPQSLTASIRLQYWPIGGKRTVRRVVNKCITCFRAQPRLAEHIMGSLPHDRVSPQRAFTITGIDFCGPFYFKAGVRNRPPVKCYISLFICFATKAVHLELVADLSTASFLAALKRFISLRGKPNTIWSDNATNFVGASNELKELSRLFTCDDHIKSIKEHCLQDGISWKFIPPHSPHFGGLWEASIKLAKHHLSRSIGSSSLSFEELRTLVYQVAAIINSRPLCSISDSPEDIEVLTPAHFLVGGPLTSFPEPNITHLTMNRMDRWQHMCQRQQIFWQRWSREYLTLLQERTKWQRTVPNLNEGAVVLIKDENLPPMKWPLARLISVIKGKDGVARVATLRFQGGTTKRAISKLCALPIKDNFVESLHLPTGGGCLEPVTHASL